jgi:Glycosyltransferase family 10 (fucosyltransferase) C-term
MKVNQIKKLNYGYLNLKLAAIAFLVAAIFYDSNLKLRANNEIKVNSWSNGWFKKSIISRHTELSQLLYSQRTSETGFVKALQTCARKTLEHSLSNNKTWQRAFSEVCIHSPGTAHKPDRISDGCRAQRFAWKRDCNREDASLYISAAEDLNTAPGWAAAGCKVVLVLEPPAVMPHSRGLIEEYYTSADIIFSSYKIDRDPDKKVFPFIYGSTWITEEERGIYKKSRATSIIASPKQATEGHRLRHAIVARYAKYGIDVFGRSYNPVDRKVQALADYRYSIIIENSQTEYYITEKLIDAFLTGTIPIYWGASEAQKIFDPTGMLVFTDEDDFQRVLKLATPEYYDNVKEAIIRNYEIALKFRCPEERLHYDFFKPLLDTAKASL